MFASAVAGPTWRAWRVCLAALFGLPAPDGDALGLYRECTGRSAWPEGPAREGWLIDGRRGGKSRVAALVAVYLACLRDYRAILAPGERDTVMLLAAERRQARVLMRYVVGLLEGSRLLARLVTRRAGEAVSLSTGLTIEIHTASYRSVRGYTVVAAVFDELAFWRSEDSANPDVEILAALRPAMATVPGALLLCISTPYARRGALWEAFQAHFARDGDPVLVWRAATRTMNPAVAEPIVRAAYAEDEAAAAAEFGGEFRRELEDYVSGEALDAVVAARRARTPATARGALHGVLRSLGGRAGYDDAGRRPLGRGARGAGLRP